jgi:cob(I)alamin adenosyltransferase
MDGKVQVYTGDGKGKTTAALGLALRAFGAGMRVCLIQFMKKDDSSEIKTLRERLPEILVSQYGTGDFTVAAPGPDDIRAASRGLSDAEEFMISGLYDVIILDEANTAVHLNLFLIDELLRLINRKPPKVELVITGRNAHPSLIERADLVTDMRMVKHYFKQGVKARRGIEW